MNKITLVDYIGNCDAKVEVTGHAAKTLQETKEMLSDSCDVSMVVTPPYAQFFDESCIASVLPYESSPQRQSSKFKKIGLYIKKICAVRNIVKNESSVWFVNTDFWLYVGLLFSKKKKDQKIFATNYLDFYSQKNLKNFIYNCAVKKIDCVFHTNVELKRDKHQYIPDYWFDKRKYDKYFTEEKQDDVYICGEINAGKDIMGAIDAFNANGQALMICGKFSSQNVYEEAVTKAHENIRIENIRLDDDTYYGELAKHRFVLLPYKEESYSNRSSGVVLESIFLGNIVIGPKFLLRQLGIAGIEYDSIHDLEKLKLSEVKEEQKRYIKKQNKVLINQYSYEHIKDVYLNRLKKIEK
ncbi:hypothetical protein [Enterococcus italicus]|uniref:hypothetical protein n=1 Tax=Enterococcus italicus TaxID=246144 RepID=UPI003F45A244